MTYLYDATVRMQRRAVLVMSSNVEALTMKGRGRGEGQEGGFGLHRVTKRVNTAKRNRQARQVKKLGARKVGGAAAGDGKRLGAVGPNGNGCGPRWEWPAGVHDLALSPTRRE